MKPYIKNIQKERFMYSSNMIARTLASTISLESDVFDIVMIEGMHQCGKTTLANTLFHQLPRVDLRDVYPRNLATTEPKSFYAVYGDHLLIDHIELAPQLLDHIPEDREVKIVLVGNLLPMDRQKLTERENAKIYTLMPLTQREYRGLAAEPFAQKPVPVTMSYPQMQLLDTIRNGFLPRPAKQMTTHAFYESWLAGFFDQVVRGTLRVAKELQFFRYLKALAEANMTELNHYKLSEIAGISYGTAIYWTDFLVSVGVIIEIPSLQLPRRRQVKRPKVCFADSGLLCHLLDCRTTEDLMTSPFYEKIFEGFVAAELIKGYAAWGEISPVTYYRDTSKKHIDLLVHTKRGYVPVGFYTNQARDSKLVLREMKVLGRMGERVEEPVLITDGTLITEKTDVALIAATAL